MKADMMEICDPRYTLKKRNPARNAISIRRLLMMLDARTEQKIKTKKSKSSLARSPFFQYIK